jgi:hypothetical protein
MRIRLLILAAVCLTIPAPAQAQIDVGVTLGRGWPGSDGSIIRWNFKRRVEGVHVGYWWTERFTTAVRFARAHLPPPGVMSYFVGCGRGAPPDCQSQRVGVLVGGKSPRQYWTIEFLRHFAERSPIRPFIGGGIGTMDATRVRRCEVPGCEALLGFSLEPARSTARNPVAIAGVNGTILRRLVVQVAVRFQRPLGEELSLFETSLGMGVRIGPLR